jgi:tRNA (guanine37-N1)-methyltransferase
LLEQYETNAEEEEILKQLKMESEKS